MTKIWGPLAWATLHSAAALFPDEPSELEKALLARWILSFRSCIVCEKCRTHFSTLLTQYQAAFPDWNTSRKNFSLFVIRAHNTVNKRNSAAILTAKEAVDHMRRNIEPEKAHLQRQSYILFVRRDWSRDTTLGGITAAKHIREVILTESEYWASKGTPDWDAVEQLVLNEDVSPLMSALPTPTRTVGAVYRPRPVVAPTGTASPPQRRVTGPIPRFSFLSR